MLKKLLVFFLIFPSLTFAETFIAGKDYQVISSHGGKRAQPEVVEFFSYGCPWCYRIEKPLNEWLKSEGKKVAFKRVPVVFNKEWENYAKAYYTAQALSMTDKLTPLLFKAIQEERHLSTRQKMIDFFVKHGVNPQVAQSAFEHSPSIDLHVKNATQLMAQYQINAVPAFVIDKRYKTDLQMAKSPERLFLILNYLLHKSD
ncbi:thiol:disulfide interchange protein DsbA/DsbL [Legionella israelensis]|uniref:Thiol:disulfide interchange protein n=1 Tax=Legionella israelensis TaxID=454 RepID=A0A0W0WJT8_9GAMM|nr:thiol:disulfide interchange protein DsbA/DsbL [Legionella israelensis]KTD32599.1 thiol:disulfide interchange protein DsbA [Legionella israelensis]QBS09857.1 thiol:disulfide interchange protein DsbA/DsbL [Legionella israelensis]SCY17848.1 Thiol:disulfide interchange protein DsbA [Legionella israelensis DSM 19235]STX59417.1 thiol:disulfide interchange protein DsbA [Legionella israelensis]